MARDTSSLNFPINLDITPLQLADETASSEEQSQWIKRYGIAGRVWEAVPYLMQYLKPPSGVDEASFIPPCSIFQRYKHPIVGRTPRILELGSGNGHLCLHHLSPLLPPGSQLVLTDLEEVTPLLLANAQLATKDGRIPSGTQVLVQPLPWGSRRSLNELRSQVGEEPFTHIICSDLVYFTNLLEPLLQTLLWLTDPPSASNEEAICSTEIIFGYKVRALHKEQAFWESLGAFFHLETVYRQMPEAHSDDEAGHNERAPSPFDEDRLLIILAKRKQDSKHIGIDGPGERLAKPLMDYKDDQFESMLLLRSMNGY